MATAKAVSPDLAPALQTALGSEVYRGLTATPKTLSPWLFYDDEGSRLFECITGLPEYYVTRTERSIFAGHAGEIVARAAEGQRLAIVELGAGTASKTGLLLQAAVDAQFSVEYFPIDVSASALEEAREHLEREIPGVHVHGRVADYTDGLGSIDVPGARRLVLYIGSSIGNFEPGDAAALLADVRRQLAPGDQLLLGADRVKPEALLLAAYDDAAGVTAAFNRNVLHRINRELHANFNVDRFAHEARWNSERSRIEMHLRSEAAQQVTIHALELELHFEDGETIHTENSYKFSDERVAGMLAGAGFRIHGQWSDPQGWFGVHLAAAE